MRREKRDGRRERRGKKGKIARAAPRREEGDKGAGGGGKGERGGKGGKGRGLPPAHPLMYMHVGVELFSYKCISNTAQCVCSVRRISYWTRGPQIIWVQCATFLDRSARAVRYLCFTIDQKITHWVLASCQVSSDSVQWFQRNSWKICQPISGQEGRLGFPIGPKLCDKNVLEVIDFLLPVKFRQILFSGFREEVVNVSAKQRTYRAANLGFRSPRQNINVVEDAKICLCQVSSNFIQWFQMNSRKCLR